MARGKKKVAGVNSDINVTPMVDVMLVLLIIFMVITPMLQKGIDGQLPETKIPEKMPENSKQLTISIKQDGSVFVSQNWVPDDQVAGALKSIHDQTPDKAVVLKGDVTIADLQAHCRTQIASYKKPRSVVFTDALPRIGASVDREVLDTRFGGGGYPGEAG